MRKTPFEFRPDEAEWCAVRSRGPGGQNVNKVATAVLLRFCIPESSLPEKIKERLLHMPDRRVGKDGSIVIRSEGERTQELNRLAALDRLRKLIEKASEEPEKRIPTKPGRGARVRRREAKKRRSLLKQSRGKVNALE
ncbi:MAG: alternative ribosome rescue aminoacyl-tRNA hydrolase ArfB [Sutterellaceae bacterium]|nr:alternative ribosome rescue aminoacyl-tRNA hydrolase ArfB [Sutterellaceae bacterium]MDY2867576.1 alternative ribosome rescue aminoacyl-tRNA hydrolase ArfB [Mesosutterella sp.]